MRAIQRRNSELAMLKIAAIVSVATMSAWVAAFAPNSGVNMAFQKPTTPQSTKLQMSQFELMVDMPPSTSDLKAQLNFDSALDGPSEIVQVRYNLPFGLDVAPKNNMAVCTKDGAGGEKVGDILRFTSCWSLGLPRGDGLITTAASFSGGVSWQCSLFDVLKASSWEEVVEALTSNVDSRTDEVLLIFERPLDE